MKNISNEDEEIVEIVHTVQKRFTRRYNSFTQTKTLLKENAPIFRIDIRNDCYLYNWLRHNNSKFHCCS